MNDKTLKYHIDEKMKKIMVDDNMKKTILNKMAEEKTSRRFNVKKAALIAAAAALVSVFPLTAAAATAVPAINDWVYSVNPQLAEYLYPINESCTDNGIKLEVESAANDSHNTRIFFTLQDTEGKGRIASDTDLCDSYYINIGSFISGGVCCESYDPETQTARFSANITSNEDLTNKMATFSLSMIMSNKTEYEKFDTGINLAEIIPEHTQIGGEKIEHIDGWSHSSESLYESESYDKPSKEDMLVPDVTNISIGDQFDYVSISNIGFIDGKLHIQTKWESSFDNHGWFTLYNGDYISGYEMIYFSTKEDNAIGTRHIEYIYDVGPEDLSNYKLLADIVEDGEIVKGDWQINFRMESMNKIKLEYKNASSAEITPVGLYINGYRGETEPSVTISYADGTSETIDSFTMESDVGFLFRKKNYYMEFGWIDIKNIVSVTINGEEVYSK